MILLVEDHDETRYALARILRHHGYEATEAADGKEALALLNKQTFDLVITDVRMPEASGLVLAAHMRVKWPHIPILLMSGYLSKDAGKIFSEGFAEFIHKPIDPPALIATVQRVLRPAK